MALTATVGFASPAMAWWDSEFAYRTRINIDTQAAGVTGEVMRAPVLVRLHTGNFNFADVKADGSDLRFVAGDDRTPLTFHIEKWSPAEEQALVWVDVQNIQPGQAAAIYAYYGNEAAEAGQDVAGTFGPDYRAVYHFDNEGAPRDATANGLNAQGGEIRNAGGLIGNSLLLDGTAPVTLPASAFGSGPLSVSFWVKPESDGTLFALPGAASLILEGGQLFIEQDGERSPGSPLETGSYAHVALVNDGQATRLFIGGQPAGEIPGALGAASGPAQLGLGFAGEIDELRVAGAALPVAAFQLAAASEGQGARLLMADTAEQVSTGGGHGYWGLLFGSLMFDAWVVIIICAFMLAIAIAIMISKGLLISRVRQANEAFLDAYGQISRRAGDHNGLPAFDAGPSAQGSTLARLYRIGNRELTERLQEGRASQSRFALRANSVAAIRSALDAGRVREGQKLHSRLVLLTIAISGGPFIGLLGTVMGVMITFASVAMAGEVNISAIAPGMAAALLATVAGLAVAIPALFGYNYLLSRIEEITADHEIFVDELEKRIAETWQDAPAAQAA
ncbi:MotA [Croceicoccus naphthovorans]|uniref:MotA n=2 Tax=Croceicoccus naphthovorans TaxID=1348774 RepID=A0A0G3XKY7_9SPHN|nr:MotA [Croceicoccus naphthovorans]